MHNAIAVRRLFYLVATAIVTVFLITGFAVPQEITLPIVDASRAGSPITLAGTIRFRDEASGALRYSFRTTLSVTNVSGKSILAVVMTIDTTGTGKIDLHNTRKDDYFFRAEIFEPNATVNLEELAGPFGEPQAEVEPHSAEPKAVAAVTFVQFADGSTWGDATPGKDILVQRRLAWDKLKSLAQTFQTNGERQFLAELKEPSQLQAVGYLQNLYESNGNDARSVIRTIASMIEYSDLHRRAMRSQDAP